MTQTAARLQLIKITCARFERQGYAFDEHEQTGGGCEAFSLVSSEGRILLITNGDGGAPYAHDLPDVVLGFYDAEGQDEGYCVVTGDDAQHSERVLDTIEAWAAGKDIAGVRFDDERDDEPQRVNCYLCEPDVSLRYAQDAGPLREVVRTKTVDRADPTEAYVLSCGHTII